MHKSLPVLAARFLFAPELCGTPFPETTPYSRPSSDEPGRGKGREHHDRRRRKPRNYETPRNQRKQNAERRMSDRRTCKVRRAPWRARSPSGVPLRLSPGRRLVPKARRQATLPETRPGRSIRYGRPNRGAETSRCSAGVTRAVLSPSSEHLTRRSLCRQGDARAARERQRRNRRPRAPQPRSRQPSSVGWCPCTRSETGRLLVLVSGLVNKCRHAGDYGIDFAALFPFGFFERKWDGLTVSKP
jgi:hypothetical protein